MGSKKNYELEVKLASEDLICNQINISSDFSSGYPTITLSLNDKESISRIMDKVQEGKLWDMSLSVSIKVAKSQIYKSSNLAIHRILPVETREGFSATIYALEANILKLIAYPASFFSTTDHMTVGMALGKITDAAGLVDVAYDEDIPIKLKPCLIPVKFLGITYFDMMREVMKVYGARLFAYTTNYGTLKFKIYDPVKFSSTKNTLGKVHLIDSSLSVDGMLSI